MLNYYTQFEAHGSGHQYYRHRCCTLCEGEVLGEKEDMDRLSVAIQTLLSAVWVGARFWGVDFLPELSRYVSIASAHPPPSFPPVWCLIMEYQDLQHTNTSFWPCTFQNVPPSTTCYCVLMGVHSINDTQCKTSDTKKASCTGAGFEPIQYFNFQNNTDVLVLNIGRYW